MSIFTEFREFIARGNVIDLAVGIIIGAAFNDIVKALVDFIIMPPIRFFTEQVDFASLQYELRPDNPETEAVDALVIQYGALINALISFLIIAWAVFMLVKLVNAIRRKEAKEPEKAPSAPTATETLLREIRDTLRAQSGHDPAPPKT